MLRVSYLEREDFNLLAFFLPVAGAVLVAAFLAGALALEAAAAFAFAGAVVPVTA